MDSTSDNFSKTCKTFVAGNAYNETYNSIKRSLKLISKMRIIYSLKNKLISQVGTNLMCDKTLLDNCLMTYLRRTKPTLTKQ